ncbi:hypothetical protein BT96DRAFT_808109 [Gymnopus androsaceus JB14]|uniref:Uncharacterized protein n=1 Tax=Gymnopus androsaceus JB14 TaxID=1447944 RepID=A0A6A4ID10_9AGAR|nr:hypothetical protein BT96DRAFT_808109 [Gymnopus androsaceus JB14]
MELTKEKEKSDWKRLSLLPIKEDEDSTNNYNEFKQKLGLELDAAGYWKYISGTEYNPPRIPELRVTQCAEGLNTLGICYIHAFRVLTMFTIPGNEAEVKLAQQKAKDWLNGDKKTRAVIARAVPLSKLYLVWNAANAHDAWLALKCEYEPANTLTAININQQIIGNACPAGGNPVSWLQSMVQLYNWLRDADPNMMPDDQFAKHLITLMSPDIDWRYCRDNLHNRLKIPEAAGKPLLLNFVIQTLKDEEVQLQLHPSVAAINAIVATGKSRKMDSCAVAGVYTASQEFVGTSTTPVNRGQSKQSH